MKDRSYAGKIDVWQSTIQNIQPSLPNIPEADIPFSYAQQKVGELRDVHAALQMLEGQRKEMVVLRRKLDQEARRAMRRLASVARGHLGFDNPVLETFGVRSEDRGRRKRTKPEPKS